ncbi:hypothetical protein F5Y16DRAFT_26223 [Xylariaceae sp. FL0255]|nr:hypothetical protein F5Y16DRAFT_26223 [Xylariaceae sp. FL0255]
MASHGYTAVLAPYRSCTSSYQPEPENYTKPDDLSPPSSSSSYKAQPARQLGAIQPESKPTALKLPYLLILLLALLVAVALLGYAIIQLPATTNTTPSLKTRQSSSVDVANIIVPTVNKIDPITTAAIALHPSRNNVPLARVETGARTGRTQTGTQITSTITTQVYVATETIFSHILGGCLNSNASGSEDQAIAARSITKTTSASRFIRSNLELEKQSLTSRKEKA